MAPFGLFGKIDSPSPEQIAEGEELERAPWMTLTEKAGVIALVVILLAAYLWYLKHWPW